MRQTKINLTQAKIQLGRMKQRHLDNMERPNIILRMIADFKRVGVATPEKIAHYENVKLPQAIIDIKTSKMNVLLAEKLVARLQGLEA